MRAAVFDRYGPPDVVCIKEVERPTPGDNELLVKIHVTTVNRTDCGYRRASPFVLRFWTGLLRPTKRPTLGTEFAGEVEAVGSSVTSFAPPATRCSTSRRRSARGRLRSRPRR